MIVVWGKVIGLAVGVFGGPLGAAFGFLVGHLVDVVAAEFLLRRLMIRVLSSQDVSRLSQFSLRVALVALVAAATGPTEWRVSGLDGAAFTAGVRDWLEETSRVRLRPWIIVKARIVARYLDAAVTIRSRIDLERLSPLVMGEFSVVERQALVNTCLNILQDTASRGSTSLIRDFAIAVEIPAEWVDRVLPRRASAGSTTVLQAEDCAVLGIRADAGLDEVKHVYRNLAAQFHPDTLAGLTPEQRRQSAEAFVRIKGAYERAVRVLEAEA